MAANGMTADDCVHLCFGMTSHVRSAALPLVECRTEGGVRVSVAESLFFCYDRVINDMILSRKNFRRTVVEAAFTGTI